MTPKREKRHCVASYCRSTGLTKLKPLFRFPKDTIQRVKWLENLGMKNSDLDTQSLICRIHFQPMCVSKRRLRDWALPTLHLGTGKTEGIHQPIRPFKPRFSCCIKNCKSQSPAVLHGFPKDPELRTKWLDLCGLKDKRKRIFICGNHFRPSFKHKTKVSKNAYPELNLNIKDNDPLQESIDSEKNNDTMQESVNDPLQEITHSKELEADKDAEKLTAALNCDIFNSISRCSSSSSGSSSISCSTDGEDDEVDDDVQKKKKAKTKCDTCPKYKNRCHKMQEQINSMRNKIIQLESKLHLQREDEEEYIWLLLNK